MGGSGTKRKRRLGVPKEHAGGHEQGSHRTPQAGRHGLDKVRPSKAPAPTHTPHTPHAPPHPHTTHTTTILHHHPNFPFVPMIVLRALARTLRA